MAGGKYILFYPFLFFTKKCNKALRSGIIPSQPNMGLFEQDAMHGKGIFKYASGAVYEGDWVMNKYEGIGKYTWPNNTSYEGEWLNNT